MTLVFFLPLISQPNFDMYEWGNIFFASTFLYGRKSFRQRGNQKMTIQCTIFSFCCFNLKTETEWKLFFIVVIVFIVIVSSSGSSSTVTTTTISSATTKAATTGTTILPRLLLCLIRKRRFRTHASVFRACCTR